MGKYNWDLSDIYSDIDAWQKDLETIDSMTKKLAAYRGKLNNKKDILSYLEESNNVSMTVDRLSLYVGLLSSCDLTCSKYKEMENNLETKLVNLSVETCFDINEFSALDDKFINDIMSDPKFVNYKKFFNNILRNKPHILSEAENRILSASSVTDDCNDIFDILSDVEMKFGKVASSKGKMYELTHSNYSVYLRSNDRTLRKNTLETMHNRYKDFAGTISLNYITHLKTDWFVSRTERFNSTLDSALFGDNIPNGVYDRLLLNVHKMLPTLYKYYDICRRILGLRDFHIYDTNAPIVKGLKKKITYEECVDEAYDILSVLGKDYVKGLKYMVDNRYVDVYPSSKKTSGAFQTSCYSVHPYVMLNFDGDDTYVSTFVHEMGHAMHSKLSDENQSYETSGHTIFVAEVASTVNEILYLNYHLDRAKTRNEKLYFLSEYIKMIKSTILRQTMFSEFESFAHGLVETNQNISEKILSDYYLGLNKKYFGKGVKVDECIKYEWMRIPHFYRSYYVYKYATGLVTAINLVENIRNKSDGLDKYLELLKSGSVDYSVPLLQKAGVDLTCDEPYKVVNKIFNNLVSEMENLTKKK